MYQRKKSTFTKHTVEIRQHTCRRSMQHQSKEGRKGGNHLRAYLNGGNAEWDDREL